uniref:Uncharacterized protein n=1 Tax=Rhizophora mucronata TaxID=61149 RepID=A0A2P2QRU5_RHIMU
MTLKCKLKGNCHHRSRTARISRIIIGCSSSSGSNFKSRSKV